MAKSIVIHDQTYFLDTRLVLQIAPELVKKWFERTRERHGTEFGVFTLAVFVHRETVYGINIIDNVSLINNSNIVSDRMVFHPFLTDVDAVHLFTLDNRHVDSHLFVETLRYVQFYNLPLPMPGVVHPLQNRVYSEPLLSA
jgi:hypothetical protein